MQESVRRKRAVIGKPIDKSKSRDILPKLAWTLSKPTVNHQQNQEEGLQEFAACSCDFSKVKLFKLPPRVGKQHIKNKSTDYLKSESSLMGIAGTSTLWNLLDNQLELPRCGGN